MVIIAKVIIIDIPCDKKSVIFMGFFKVKQWLTKPLATILYEFFLLELTFLSEYKVSLVHRKEPICK